MASLGLVTAAPAMAATIPPAAIAGVIAPATGVAPVTTITATQYTGVVTWSPTVSGTFAASTAYTAIIILTPTSGYTLTGVTANFFTVAGATGGVTNQANSGVVTAVFPATAAGLAVVSTAGILGVSAPVTGGTPVAAIADNGQYTGTVAWGGSPSTFAVSTSYTATITLIADAGYTFTGVAANFFTVAGATATNSSGSGVVTAVFPATTTVTIGGANLAIAGVTAPVAWNPSDGNYHSNSIYCSRNMDSCCYYVCGRDSLHRNHYTDTQNRIYLNGCDC